MKNISKNHVKIAVFLLIALFSAFVMSRVAASPAVHSSSIAYLENRQKNVAELMAAATSSSVAISALPGDTAQPIAEQLVKISTYFLVVLCALFLEKYLLTVMGYVTFGLLFPAACVLFALFFWLGRRSLFHVAKRLILFGILLFLIVPTSVQISKIIDKTYENAVTAAIQGAQELELSSSEINGAEIENSTETNDGWMSSMVDKFKDAKDSITDKVTDTVKKAETILNQYLESLAVMIVTSCLIPILVMLFFAWLVKIALGAEASFHSFKRM